MPVPDNSKRNARAVRQNLFRHDFDGLELLPNVCHLDSGAPCNIWIEPLRC